MAINVDKHVGIGIGVAVLSALFVALLPTIATSLTGLGGNMSLYGIPFATFFATGGVLFLLLGVFLFYTFYRMLQGGK